MSLAHRNAHGMAKCLASYIDSPERIRAEVATVWDNVPYLWAIKRYRKQHLNPKVILSTRDYERGVVNDDERYADQMARSSAALRDGVISLLLDIRARGETA